MARLSDLVLDLAAVLRMEATTINTYARHLREAGLLSQGGRGVNAAHVTALDAARLLIALMVDGYAKDAPQIVRDFGRAVLFLADEDEQPEDLQFRSLLGLEIGCSLEQFFAGIIELWADDEKYHIMSANSEEYYAATALEIASVTVSATCFIKRGRYEFHSREFHDLQTAALGDYSSFAAWDQMTERYFRGLRRTTNVATPELVRVGELLGGRRLPGQLPTREDEIEALLTSLKEPPE